MLNVYVITTAKANTGETTNRMDIVTKSAQNRKYENISCFIIEMIKKFFEGLRGRCHVQTI